MTGIKDAAVRFDIPLSVEASFSRYHMHTDLVTAMMVVRFKI